MVKLELGTVWIQISMVLEGYVLMFSDACEVKNIIIWGENENWGNAGLYF
jgi:hypothetical protein